MQLLLIDFGSYSVKFLHARVEKRKVRLGDFEEIPVHSYKAELEGGEDADQEEKGLALIDHQISIVEGYLKKTEFDGRLIYQLPQTLVTTRYLNLPVKNRKKAEQMIPFQLEEDIPYSSGQAHYGQLLIPGQNSTKALVGVSDKTDFEDFYKKIRHIHAIPHRLTTEPALIENFAHQGRGEDAWAVIDMGHTTTKVYFLKGDLLVANHVSYIAGKAFDQAIAENYNTTEDGARDYKHDQGFFLTQQQLENAPTEQRDFAVVMGKTFEHLYHELKRWELGFFVTHRVKISKVYLCGGMANVKNIHNLFAQTLGVPCEPFNPFARTVTDTTWSEYQMNGLAMATLMAQTQLPKSVQLNMLTGEFAQSSKESIPLNTIAFTSLRVAILLIFIAAGFSFELYRLGQVEKDLNRVARKVFKSDQLGISSRKGLNLYRRRPELVERAIQKRLRLIKGQYRDLESENKHDALKVFQFIGALSSKDVKMIRLKSLDSGLVEASFQSKKKAKLEELKERLEILDVLAPKVEVSGETLNFSFSMEMDT